MDIVNRLLSWELALTDEDADEIADDLPLDSSALLIAYENIWMTNIVLAFAAAEADQPVERNRLARGLALAHGHGQPGIVAGDAVIGGDQGRL